MNNQVKIRKAKKEDTKEIAQILINESSKKPHNESYDLKTALKEVKGFFKGELYVSIGGKEIRGFLASSITPDNKQKAYLNELWLKPNYQRKGLGKSLVKFIENYYKKRGVKIVRLVSKRNAEAFKFYKKIDYKQIRDLVFMEKKLK